MLKERENASPDTVAADVFWKNLAIKVWDDFKPVFLPHECYVWKANGKTVEEKSTKQRSWSDLNSLKRGSYKTHRMRDKWSYVMRSCNHGVYWRDNYMYSRFSIKWNSIFIPLAEKTSPYFQFIEFPFLQIFSNIPFENRNFLANSDFWKTQSVNLGQIYILSRIDCADWLYFFTLQSTITSAGCGITICLVVETSRMDLWSKNVWKSSFMSSSTSMSAIARKILTGWIDLLETG